MSGVAAVIPVKRDGFAKQRLSGTLSETERIELVASMLADLLDALLAARGLERIVVVTPDGEGLAAALPAEVEVLTESPGTKGLNGAVSFAADWCRDAGFEGALILPLDLPLVTAHDVETILAAAPRSPSVTLVGARDGDGTNALLTKPPDVIPFQYGPGSFRAHLGSAVNRLLTSVVLELPNVALDVDHPDDLTELAARPGQSRAQRWLRDHRPPEGRSS